MTAIEIREPGDPHVLVSCERPLLFLPPVKC
ncbi:MAG: hypothetical protein ACI9DC_001093 [Gammaproteobacteria bacterium]|jgi:hypothetical protein